MADRPAPINVFLADDAKGAEVARLIREQWQRKHGGGSDREASRGQGRDRVSEERDGDPPCVGAIGATRHATGGPSDRTCAGGRAALLDGAPTRAAETTAGATTDDDMEHARRDPDPRTVETSEGAAVTDRRRLVRNLHEAAHSLRSLADQLGDAQTEQADYLAGSLLWTQGEIRRCADDLEEELLNE